MQPATLENPDGTYSSHYQHTSGVTGVTNFENVLFQDNNTNVTLTVDGGGTSYKYSYVDVRGGALNNSASIDTLSGAFINNSITSTINEVSNRDYDRGYVYAYGGALYNSGNITNLNATFSNNSISGGSYSYGGALYNAGNITNLNATFSNNSISGGSYSYGGALYNAGNITNLNADFINNSINGDYYQRHGGALYNAGTISNINGNFVGNSARYGGAIYNDGTIGGITGTFIDNTADSEGGAIYNNVGATIGDINADFINNYASDGTISNSGKIGDITGNFVGNSMYVASGVIHNYYDSYDNQGSIAEIGNITGNFINNSNDAIYNEQDYDAPEGSAKIGDITGNFIGNRGGIRNYDGVIGNVTGNFIGNGYGISSNGVIGNITGDFINNGTGINVSGIVGDITGDFIGNGDAIYIGSTNGSNINGLFIDNERYAIRNSGLINNITAEFYNNGTAVYNYGTINNIKGNFIGNNEIAISNHGTIGNITGDFIGNGQAIFQQGEINSINSNFIQNEKEISSYDNPNSGGGAVAFLRGYPSNINSVTGTINGNFTKNIIKSLQGTARGGAIFAGLGGENVTASEITIGEITGNFERNKAVGDIARGGAIYIDSARINKIKGNFINNSAEGITGASGGAIYISDYYDHYNNHAIGKIETLDAEQFISNSAISEQGGASGGAIFNNGQLDDLETTFVNNYVSGYTAAYGGAIYNTATIGSEDGGIINTSFYNNYAKSENGEAKGGAIYSTADLNIIAKDGGQSVFSGNYTESKGVQTPNAIYLGGVGSVTQQDQVTSINTQTVTTERIEQIIVPDLTLNAVSNGTILFDDAIDGDLNSTVTTTFTGDLVADRYNTYYSESIEEFLEKIKNDPPYWADDNWGNLSDEEILESAYEHGFLYMTNVQSTTESSNNTGYSLKITGDETGKVILNNDVTAHIYDDEGNVTAQAPVNISLENTNLYLGARDNIFDGNNLNLKSGFMSMVNDSAGISALNNLTVSGDVNFAADVDLANKEMDRFTAAEYGEHTGNINVIGMNLLSDASMDEDVTAIYFAEPGLKDNVVNGTGELPDSYQTAYTPIYKYNVTYDNENEYDGKGDGGYFLFTRGGLNSGNDSDNFNPSVLVTPVGNLAAGQAAMNEAFKYVFEHADAFTQLPAMERYAQINANKYAMSTDFNDNLPSYTDNLHNKGVWFRPYTTFETMNLDNGPKVDAITYGSLVGFDGDFKEMKNGWHRVFTGYAGYMGSSLNYSGVDTSLNGGLLGFTETFYKGNFWTAITASAGAAVGESHSMYGKEDYTSLLAGVGSKTGYNFEFKDGKFIIQPIMFLSYTFVNTFDYKNAAGVNIESDPLHTIQLNPSVRFIANLKGGWQPYASVGMVWNLMNESKVTANNVKLPEMSVKPYVEYGVGVQRNWADKFTAFLQAMIRNGGRNGIALTGGFRFMLGSDDDNDKPKVKKEIKSL